MPTGAVRDVERLDLQAQVTAGGDDTGDVGMNLLLRHASSLSTAAAKLRSLSVTVDPAECVVSEISTVFHEFDQSG